MKVFISYAREDKAHAKSLAEFLSANNHEVWWDHLIYAGADFRNEIIAQLAQADKVVVLWSSHSVRSPFVIDEAQHANESGKLIPIVIDVSDPPMGFGHLHAIKAADLTAEFPAILAAIENRAAPPREATTRARPWRSAALATGAIVLLAVGAMMWWRAGTTPPLKYLGCYAEMRGAAPEKLTGRVLGGAMLSDDPKMTIGRCINYCASKGFAYAGLQYASWCFCGNAYRKAGPATNCNMQCSGDQSQTCGGAWANSVYATK